MPQVGAQAPERLESVARVVSVQAGPANALAAVLARLRGIGRRHFGELRGAQRNRASAGGWMLRRSGIGCRRRLGYSWTPAIGKEPCFGDVHLIGIMRKSSTAPS